MSVVYRLTIGLLCCAVLSAPANASCSLTFRTTLVGVERVVDSLRPEKGGVARVFAYDGTEYTAGEALWMKGKLDAVQRDCRDNAEARAQPQLEEILALIRSRHTATGRGDSWGAGR